MEMSTRNGAADQLERVRYFPGQLLTPDDLIQEQEFHRERMRRHNRLLHGWGVGYGARVRPREGDAGAVVVVEPGYLLGPYGDEIVIEREVEVDLLAEDLDGHAVPCGGPDPARATVPVTREPGQELYLAVRYAACPTRPVRAHPGGCGGEGSECEYSRVRDGFVMELLTELPESHQEPAGEEPTLAGVLRCPGGHRPVPPMPADPWLVLATVTMEGASTVGTVDDLTHRRFVAAWGSYHYTCGGGGPTGPGPAAPVPPVVRLPADQAQRAAGEEATAEVRAVGSAPVTPPGARRPAKSAPAKNAPAKKTPPKRSA